MLKRDDIARYLTSEVVFAGERWPGFSDTVEHRDGVVLVDTGMIDSTPELDREWQPTPHPLPDEVVQGAQRLVDRGVVVVAVQLVQVDVVGLQPPQRILDRRHDVLA